MKHGICGESAFVGICLFVGAKLFRDGDWRNYLIVRLQSLAGDTVDKIDAHKIDAHIWQAAT